MEHKIGMGFVLTALLVSAGVFVLGAQVIGAPFSAGDLYGYFYPKALYAVASMHDGWRGILWNPYQSCGQPFLGSSQTGAFNPVFLLFLLLDPELALRAVLLVQLVLGGMLAYLLGRAIGAGRPGAVGCALAFECGMAMVSLSAASPAFAAAYALMPGALWCAERLCAHPSLRRAIALAVILALAVLPGYPQFVLFSCELVGLRLLWEVVTRRRESRPLALLTLGAVAFVLAAILAAVELLPEIEVARESLRSGTLSSAEISPQGSFTWDRLGALLTMRSVGQPFVVLPTLFGLAAFSRRSTRRVALFYAVAGALSLGLAFGPGTPIFDLYSHLPGVSVFRQPARFLWVTSFCGAVLAGLGVDALANVSRRAGWLPGLLAGVMLAAAGLALDRLIPGGMSRTEGVAAALAVIVMVAVGLVPGLRAGAGLGLVVALGVPFLLAPSFAPVGLLRDPPALFAARSAFAAVERRMGPQDRLHLIHGNSTIGRYAFMSKTASLFRVPAVYDYEPLLSRRFMEFWFMLQVGQRLQSLNQALYVAGPRLDRMSSHRLLDLAAVRYLLVAPELVADAEQVTPPLRRLDTVDGLTLFENPTALPRAFFVPRVEVISSQDALLARLPESRDDLQTVAFVEQPVRSGFMGSPHPAGDARVEFRTNDPERVTLDVEAPVRGFLVLSDQYFPGWRATVNGRPATIERANYVFRLVEVPAGPSTVEFTYVPLSLAIGALVSGGGAVGVLGALWWTRVA